jgi:hypothetical protein
MMRRIAELRDAGVIDLTALPPPNGGIGNRPLHGFVHRVSTATELQIWRQCQSLPRSAIRLCRIVPPSISANSISHALCGPRCNPCRPLIDKSLPFLAVRNDGGFTGLLGQAQKGALLPVGICITMILRGE